jgi:hypothetical protein
VAAQKAWSRCAMMRPKFLQPKAPGLVRVDCMMVGHFAYITQNSAMGPAIHPDFDWCHMRAAIIRATDVSGLLAETIPPFPGVEQKSHPLHQFIGLGSVRQKNVASPQKYHPSDNTNSATSMRCSCRHNMHTAPVFRQMTHNDHRFDADEMAFVIVCAIQQLTVRCGRGACHRLRIPRRCMLNLPNIQGD